MEQHNDKLFYSDNFKQTAKQSDFIGASDEWDDDKEGHFIAVPKTGAVKNLDTFKQDFINLIKSGNYNAASTMYKNFGTATVREAQKSGAGSAVVQGRKQLVFWMQNQLLSYQKYMKENKGKEKVVAAPETAEIKTQEMLNIDAATKVSDNGIGFIQKAICYAKENKLVVALGAAVVALGVALYIKLEK